MDMNQAGWRCLNDTSAEGPSLDFIRAIAELLETDAEDILSELGYARSEEPEVAVVSTEREAASSMVYAVR